MRSTGVRAHGRCHSVGNRMVEVTKLIEIFNRNTENIKIAVENAILYRKICDMRTLLKYAKYAAIAYSHTTDMRS